NSWDPAKPFGAWRSLLSFTAMKHGGRELSGAAPGGAVIAIIGPDGSGKSTLAREMVERLGPSATSEHLGGPPAGTWLTRHLRALIRAVRKVPRALRRETSLEGVEQRYPTFQAMLDICTALDRR